MTIQSYVIYNASTGEIKCQVNCDDADVLLNTPSGHNYLLGAENDGAHMVDLTQTPPVVVPKPAPDAATQLATAKSIQAVALNAAYNRAILGAVSYTTHAGATATFAQDATAKANLQNALLGSQASSTWTLGIWLDVTGTVVSPFTFADLQGLAAAMEGYDTPKYSELLTLLGAVNAATTITAVQAIVWT